MDKAQLLKAIKAIPKNPLEWDTAILAEKIQPVLLALIDQVPLTIEVSDITNLTNEQLDSLRVGDVVAKITGTAKHLYLVSYKDAENGGICLSYNAAGYGETVAYDHSDSGWTYNSTDIKTYGEQ